MFYEGGISHNEDIMHSFQKFVVVSIPTTLPSPPLERRIWKLVVRALPSFCFEFLNSKTFYLKFVRNATYKTCLELKLTARIISKQNSCVCSFGKMPKLHSVVGSQCVGCKMNQCLWVYFACINTEGEQD